MPFEISAHIQPTLAQHVNCSENGLAVLDADDNFLFYNHSFADMFGLSEASTPELTHRDFITRLFSRGTCTHFDRSGLEAWLEHVNSHHRTEPFGSFEIQLHDGRWLLLTKQVYEGGRLVMACVDITKHKQAELALRAAHEELERLAMTDELTGTSNRRHFLAQMEKEYERARRYRHFTSLAMLDLDHFKRVNDRYGHPAGDQVLKHFGALLLSHLRSEDAVGRLGGEEFALLLPETEQAGARTVLERIRQDLAGAALESIAPDFRYTFSAGIAELEPDTPFTCDDWVRAADQALYQAKSDGRNRSVVHHRP
jgi:diguanylate cyclase (GGDEF)-like protein